MTEWYRNIFKLNKFWENDYRSYLDGLESVRSKRLTPGYNEGAQSEREYVTIESSSPDELLSKLKNQPSNMNCVFIEDKKARHLTPKSLDLEIFSGLSYLSLGWSQIKSMNLVPILDKVFNNSDLIGLRLGGLDIRIDDIELILNSLNSPSLQYLDTAPWNLASQTRVSRIYPNIKILDMRAYPLYGEALIRFTSMEWIYDVDLILFNVDIGFDYQDFWNLDLCPNLSHGTREYLDVMWEAFEGSVPY